MVDKAVTVDGNTVTNDGQGLSEHFRAMLTCLWREARRHVELSQSAEVMAKLLAEHLPLGQLLVRRVDSDRSLLETIAAYGGVVHAAEGQVSRFSPAEFRTFLQWCGEGRVARLPRREPGDEAARIASAGVPAGIEEDMLLAPLHDEQGPAGVLLLVAARFERFDQQHADMAQTLVEPFSAALEIDAQLREVAAIQAVEADKLSLLNKVGRKPVGDVVVGAEGGLRGVMERVELVSRSDVPVLVLGETGTGKEVVARMIHTRSPRSSGPFLRVNCGAIPLELIDSQLFGHERGAFTGAVEARQGWFERADGGTLLLDEVGELPLAAQVRLLRILQDGWLERVGGHESVHVNVRVIAATHRNLTAMTKAGTFREDLWYRLAVFPIHLPPLRERCEDIPALALHFAERAATRFAFPPLMPSARDVEQLASYPWPGNIRELASVIDRAAILGEGKRLEVAKALGLSQVHASPETMSKPSAATQPVPEFLTLDEAMKQHIEAALDRAHGQIEGKRGAAALLKINPHTLRARMRKLKIEWSRFRHEE